MRIYSFFLLTQSHLKTVLLILFFITLISGYFIYSQFYGLDFSASLYYALSLFLGDVKKPVEIGIESEPQYWDLIYISGFIGFFTSALAFVMTFLKEWVMKLSNRSVLSSKDYILVIGFGENNRYYVDSEIKGKSRILVLEIQENKPQISAYQDKGVYFEVVNASKKDILDKYVKKGCKHVVVSTGSDIVNFNIAIILKDLIKGKTKAFIHFSRRNIEIFMSQKMIFVDSIKHFEFYSYNEIAARGLFLKQNKNITEGVDTIESNSRVKILIVGFGDLGQEVALQALKLGSFYNKQKLSLTIVDKEDETKESFLSLHPQAQNIADFKFIKLNVKSESFQQKIIDNFDYTYVVVCLPDDNETIDLLFNLEHHLTQKDFIQGNDKYSKIPIAVRFKQSNSINLKDQISERMFQFGITSDISTKEKIIDEVLDKKARKLNEEYNKGQKDNWSELDNFTKDSNRSSVEHFDLVKQGVLEHFKIKNEDDFNRKIEHDQTLKDNLVDLEHRRWNNFHLLHNWQYKEASEWYEGSEMKTSYQEHKVHTCLVEADELEKLEEKLGQPFRENDLNTYRTLLKMEK